MEKKCKVVMLPTDEKAIIHLHPSGIMYKSEEAFIQKYKKIKSYHLYIISDDKIEEEDYCIDDNGVFGPWEKSDVAIGKFKKIIATTDKSLGLPSPSTAFIQKYVGEYNKSNVITDVMVEYECSRCQYHGYVNECRKDCNGLFRKLKVDTANEITIRKLKDSWNREEVLDLLEFVNDRLPDLYSRFSPEEEFEKWIEENL